MKIILSSTLLVAASARKLQEFTAIAGFSPLTDVRDQLRIDLDVRKVMELYKEGSDESIASAKKIYEEGSFSKTVSDLTIDGGLAVDVPQGTVFEGVSFTDGATTATARQASTVRVFAYNAASAGDTTLSVQYFDEGCYVGANPDPETAGCLAAAGSLTSTGSDTTITIDSYTYDVLSTRNVYSVQLFTQPSEYRFFEGAEITEDFQNYVTYYGSESFNDDIIQAVFAGTSTSFSTGKNFDFSGMGLAERAEVLEVALGYLAVRNYVFRELEHAIYLCETDDCAENSCFNKPAVHEIDEAVAFYVGSLEGADGSGDGVLTYEMANNRGAEFGVAPNGLSTANIGMFEAFDDASEAIVANDCAGGRTATTTISQLNNIPLVQSLLKYTYLSKDGGGTKVHQAERVAYALNVLPIINGCSEADAETVYQNTKVGAATVDYDAVSQAVSNNYGCLGITAEDIGKTPSEDDSVDPIDLGGGTDEGVTVGDHSAANDRSFLMTFVSAVALMAAFVFV